jgi:hypothetical protein
MFAENNILSGTMSYRLIGRDSFIINLELFRDCNSESFGSIEVSVVDADNNKLLKTLQINKPSAVDITPSCSKFNSFGCTKCMDTNCQYPYGIELYRYQKLLVLESTITSCKIRIEYSACCRSNNINNIKKDKGFYIYAFFNRCLAQWNNLDINWTNLNAYNNRLSEITPYIEDYDIDSNGGLMDSLYFELSTPTDIFGNSAFLDTFSKEKPFPFSGFPNSNLSLPEGFHFNHSVGTITFTPNTTGQFLYTIKIKEFRNKTLIGEYLFDNILIVVPDTFIHVPQLITDTYYKEIHYDSTVTFTINTWHPDPHDTLTIWQTGDIEGSKWTDNNKSTNHPTGQFSWKPDQSFVSDVPYNFVVSVKSYCFLQGRSVRTFQILVTDRTNNMDKKINKHFIPVQLNSSILRISYSQIPELILLYNIDGKLVKKINQSQISDIQTDIDITTLSSGIYTLSLLINGEFQVEKVNINKL